ncbi:MAG: hypothetical protein KDI79_16255 [Anaerolineae bacterium]|nr:hypothetical protein [Anaerolineae bacterium]
MADQHNEVLDNPDIDFERSDVNYKLMIGSVILLIVVTVCSMLLSIWIYGTMETRQVESRPTPFPLIQLRPTPPPPRLQPNPIDRTTGEEDLSAMHQREDAILESYGWVDEEQGIVRIPIDRAIDVLAGEAAEEEPGR